MSALGNLLARKRKNSGGSGDGKQQSQINKCLNEKRRREQENIYIEELAELISASITEMNTFSVKPDKCAILQETVSQIRRIKNEESCTSDAVQQSHVSSSKPTILANDVLGPLLLEALDGFLFVVNCQGKVEFVSDNISQYLKYQQDDLVNKSIYNIIHVGDHAIFSKGLVPLSVGSIPWNPDGAAYKGRTFNCRMLIKPPDDENDVEVKQTHVSQYEGMQISAVLVPYPNSRDNLGLADDTDGQSCLVCIARTLAITEKRNSMLGIEQFTTKQNINGQIVGCDTSGIKPSKYRYPDFDGHNIIDFAHANDVQLLNKHLQEVTKSGKNPTNHTSSVYRFKLRDNKYVFVQTKSRLFSKPVTSEPEFVMSTHSIIRECDSDIELKGSASTSLMKSIIGQGLVKGGDSEAAKQLLGPLDPSTSNSGLPLLGSPSMAGSGMVSPLPNLNFLDGIATDNMSLSNVLEMIPTSGPWDLGSMDNASSANSLEQNANLYSMAGNFSQAVTTNAHNPTSQSWSNMNSMSGVRKQKGQQNNMNITLNKILNSSMGGLQSTRPAPLNIGPRSSGFDRTSPGFAGAQSPIYQNQRSPSASFPRPSRGRSPSMSGFMPQTLANHTAMNGGMMTSGMNMMSPTGMNMGQQSSGWNSSTSGTNSNPQTPQPNVSPWGNGGSNPQTPQMMPRQSPVPQSPLQALKSMEAQAGVLQNLPIMGSMEQMKSPVMAQASSSRDPLTIDTNVKRAGKLRQLLTTDILDADSQSEKDTKRSSNRSSPAFAIGQSPKEQPQSTTSHDAPDSTKHSPKEKSNPEDNVILKQLLSQEDEDEEDGDTQMETTSKQEDNIDMNKNEAEPKPNKNELLKKLLNDDQSSDKKDNGLAASQNALLQELLMKSGEDSDSETPEPATTTKSSKESPAAKNSMTPRQDNLTQRQNSLAQRQNSLAHRQNSLAHRQNSMESQQLSKAKGHQFASQAQNVSAHLPFNLNQAPSQMPSQQVSSQQASQGQQVSSQMHSQTPQVSSQLPPQAQQVSSIGADDELLGQMFPNDGPAVNLDRSVISQDKNLQNLLSELWESSTEQRIEQKADVASTRAQKRKASSDVDSTGIDFGGQMSLGSMLESPSTSTNRTNNIAQKNALLTRLLTKNPTRDNQRNVIKSPVSPSEMPQNKLPKNLHEKIVDIQMSADNGSHIKENIRPAPINQGPKVAELGKLGNEWTSPRTDPNSPFPGNTNRVNSSNPQLASQTPQQQQPQLPQQQPQLPQQQLPQNSSSNLISQSSQSYGFDQIQLLLSQSQGGANASATSTSFNPDNEVGTGEDQLFQQILQQATDLQNDVSNGQLNQLNSILGTEPTLTTTANPNSVNGASTDDMLAQLDQAFPDIDDLLGLGGGGGSTPQSQPDLQEQLAIDAIQKQLMSIDQPVSAQPDNSEPSNSAANSILNSLVNPSVAASMPASGASPMDVMNRAMAQSIKQNNFTSSQVNQHIQLLRREQQRQQRQQQQQQQGAHLQQQNAGNSSLTSMLGFVQGQNQQGGQGNNFRFSQPQNKKSKPTLAGNLSGLGNVAAGRGGGGRPPRDFMMGSLQSKVRASLLMQQKQKQLKEHQKNLHHRMMMQRQMTHPPQTPQQHLSPQHTSPQQSQFSPGSFPQGNALSGMRDNVNMTFTENFNELMNSAVVPNVSLQRNTSIPGPMSPQYRNNLSGGGMVRPPGPQQMNQSQISPSFTPRSQAGQPSWNQRSSNSQLQGIIAGQMGNSQFNPGIMRSQSMPTPTSQDNSRFQFPDSSFPGNGGQQPMDVGGFSPQQSPQQMFAQNRDMPQQRMSMQSRMNSPQNNSQFGSQGHDPMLMSPHNQMTSPHQKHSPRSQVSPQGLMDPLAAGMSGRNMNNFGLQGRFDQQMFAGNNVGQQSNRSMGVGGMGQTALTSSQLVKQELQKALTARCNQSQQHMSLPPSSSAPSMSAISAMDDEIPQDIIDQITELTQQQQQQQNNPLMGAAGATVTLEESKVVKQKREEAHRTFKKFQKLAGEPNQPQAAPDSGGAIATNLFRNQLMSGGEGASGSQNVSLVAKPPDNVNVVQTEPRTPIEAIKPADQKNSLLQQLLSD
ncbi:unnamed protein product [Owenia fusiformis]|uniref:Uncharacterized protein n=1 Tax=Owenia fusiformis TaxID=6347 RepID=A0A8J1Y0S1_OWEFU|nr:unnamed protein product [Owenia fusiformis]